MSRQGVSLADVFTRCSSQHLLGELAQECRVIVHRAERALGPLPKASYVDLCADNIAHASIADIKAALVVAGVGY